MENEKCADLPWLCNLITSILDVVQYDISYYHKNSSTYQLIMTIVINAGNYSDTVIMMTTITTINNINDKLNDHGNIYNKQQQQ